MIERLATISTSDIISIKAPLDSDFPQAGERREAHPIPDSSEPVGPLSQAVHAFEQAYIQRALDQCGGNVTQAAKLLGIHRSAIYRKQSDSRSGR